MLSNNAPKPEHLPPKKAIVGWWAVALGAINWSCSVCFWINATQRFYEPIQEAYEAAAFGVIAAIVVGLGIRSVRKERPSAVGWLAVTLGATLVLHSILWLAPRGLFR